MAELSADAPVMESDFSPRKMKVAAVILLGQSFASSLVPLYALGYVLVYMTKEFGWSRAEFLGANTALLLVGALVSWPTGLLTDRIGARPVIILGTLGVGLTTLLVPLVHNKPIGFLPRAWAFYAIFALIGLLAAALILLKMILFPSYFGEPKLVKLMALLLGAFGATGLAFLIAGLWRLGRTIKHRPKRGELPPPSRRSFVEDVNPPDTAALPPLSIQHPVQHSVTEATTGLLPQEVERTNELK